MKSHVGSLKGGIAGEILGLGYQNILRAFRWPWRGTEISHSIVQMALGSLPIITLSTAFAGLVVGSEIAWHMDQALHTVQMIPGFTAQFILRELGVVVPALILVAKVGASTTAEIGMMKITEQIDALRLLKVDPISYLVFPRWIACIVSCVCLVFISIAVSIGCALLVAVSEFHFTVIEYLNAVRQFVTWTDIVCALCKGIALGGIIPIISCAYGFRCKGGAEGVGQATTQSVVTSTVAVIVADFILTYFFSRFL